MTTDDADRWSVRRRIEQIGFVELGRRFGLVTVAGLEAIRAGGWPAAGADPEDEWIDGYCGEDSSDEEFFVMILAALSAVRGHEGAT